MLMSALLTTLDLDVYLLGASEEYLSNAEHSQPSIPIPLKNTNCHCLHLSVASPSGTDDAGQLHSRSARKLLRHLLKRAAHVDEDEPEKRDEEKSAKWHRWSTSRSHEQSSAGASRSRRNSAWLRARSICDGTGLQQCQNEGLNVNGLFKS